MQCNVHNSFLSLANHLLLEAVLERVYRLMALVRDLPVVDVKNGVGSR